MLAVQARAIDPKADRVSIAGSSTGKFALGGRGAVPVTRSQPRAALLRVSTCSGADLFNLRASLNRGARGPAFSSSSTSQIGIFRLGAAICPRSSAHSTSLPSSCNSQVSRLTSVTNMASSRSLRRHLPISRRSAGSSTSFKSGRSLWVGVSHSERVMRSPPSAAASLMVCILRRPILRTRNDTPFCASESDLVSK